MRKITLIISIFVEAVILVAIFLFFSSTIHRLESQVEQSNNIAQSTHQEAEHLQQDKKMIGQDIERLKSDTVSYLALNSQLREQNEGLEKKLRDMQKAKESQAGILQQTVYKLEELVKANNAALGRQARSIKNRDRLIAYLDATLKNERNLFHYNLGVAYSQAKFYPQAIDELEESLQFNPNNPDAYYNLGLLYENFKKDPKRAVEFYRRYLSLKPEAEDRQEVEAWIDGLKRL